MPETACQNCGRIFKHPESQQRQFCGRECRQDAMRKRMDQECGGAGARFYRQVKGYKDNAAKRGLAWLLTYQDCERLMAKACAYCGKPGPSGIDRFNNWEGYHLANVLSCCTDCNMLKGSTHWTVFLDQVRKIYLHCNAHGRYAAVDLVLEECNRDGA